MRPIDKINYNTTLMGYRGDVKVDFKLKNKVISVKKHNAGLPDLSRCFCDYLAGNPPTIEKIPQFLDLRMRTAGEGDYDYQSVLVQKVHLSGAVYDFDEDSNSYAVTFVGVITYQNLAKAITAEDDAYYRLYLYSGSLGTLASGDPSGYYDLAYLDMDAAELSNLGPGTQASVAWTLKLINIEEENEV